MPRRNLLTNPSFETGVAAWSRLAAASGTADAISREINANYGARSGSYYAFTRRTTAGRLDVYADEVPVTAGQSYAGQVQVNRDGTGAVGLDIDWYTASDTYISSSRSGDITPGTATWATLTAVGVAPANAAAAQLYVRFMAQGANQYVRVDAAMLEPATAAGAYADGDTAGWGWEGTAHASSSREAIRNECPSPEAVTGWSGGGTSGTPASSFAQNQPLNAGVMDGATAAVVTQSGLSGNARLYSARRSYDTDQGGVPFAATIQGWPEPPPTRCTNPVAASDLSGWFASGPSGYTPSRVTGLTGMVATTGMRVANGSTAGVISAGGDYSPASPGEVVTATLQARPSVAATLTWALVFCTSSGAEISRVSASSQSVAAGVATVNRVSGTCPANTAFVRAQVTTSSLAASASLTVTGHRVDLGNDTAMEYAGTLSCALELTFRNASGAQVSGSPITGGSLSIVTGGPGRVYATGVAPTGTRQVEAVFLARAAGAKSKVWATAARIDALSTAALPYADGDTTGWAWDGAAGTSTSGVSSASKWDGSAALAGTAALGAPAQVGAAASASLAAGASLGSSATVTPAQQGSVALAAAAVLSAAGQLREVGAAALAAAATLGAPAQLTAQAGAALAAAAALATSATVANTKLWAADTDSSSASSTGTAIGYTGTQYQPGPPAGSSTTQPIQNNYTPIPVEAAPGGRPGRATRTKLLDNEQRYEHRPDHRSFDIGDAGYFFSVAFFLDADFPITGGDYQVIEQLHQAWGSWSPPVAFEIQQGYLCLTGGNGLPNGSSNPREFAHFQRLAPVSLQQWYSLIYTVDVFSDQTYGSRITVWLDGAKLLDKWVIPCPTIVQGDAANRLTYRKQGFYHRPSIPGGTIWHAGAAMGTSYGAVDPYRQLANTAWSGSAALAAGASLGAAASRATGGAAALAADAALASTGTRLTTSGGPLAADAALAGSGVRVQGGATALAAAAALGAVATPNTSSATLAAQGALAGDALRATSGAAALTAAAGLAADAVRTTPAGSTLSAAALLAGGGVRQTSSPATLAAAAALAASGDRATGASGLLAAAAVLGAESARATSGAAALAAAAMLAADGVRTAPNTIILAADATLAATGVRQTTSPVALAAAAALGTAAVRLTPGAGLLAADAALTGTGVRLTTSPASLGALAALSAAATTGGPASATLVAAASLAGAGVRTTASAAALAAAAGLGSTAQVGAAARGALGADAALAAAGFLVVPASGGLAGAATLTGPAAVLTARGSGALAAAASLSAFVGLPSSSAALRAAAFLGAAAGAPIKVGAAGLAGRGDLGAVVLGGFAIAPTLAATARLLVDSFAFTPLYIPPPGPSSPLVPIPALRLLAVDTVTGRVGYELPFNALSWSMPLNGIPTGDTTLVLEDVRDAVAAQGAADPRAAVREVLTGPFRYSLVVVWGGQAICGGPYLPSEDLTPGRTIKVGFAGIERILERRVLSNVRGFGGWADPSRDVHVERTTPAGAIYSLVGASVDTVDGDRPGRALPIVCSDPPPLIGDEGFVWLSYDLVTAWKAITEIVERDDGPDVRFEPLLSERDDGLYVEWDLQIGSPYLVGSGPPGPDGPLPFVVDDETSLIARSTDAVGLGSAFWGAGAGQDRDKVIVRADTSTLTDLGFPELDTVSSGGGSETDELKLNRSVRAAAEAGATPSSSWTVKVPADGLPPRGAVRRGDPVTIEALNTLLIDPGRHTRRVTTVAGDAGSFDSWTCDHEDDLAAGDPVALGQRAWVAPSLAPTGTVTVPGSGGVSDNAARWLATTVASKQDRSTSLPISSPANGADQQLVLVGISDLAADPVDLVGPSGFTLIGASPDPHGGWVKVWTKLAKRADVNARFTVGTPADASVILYCSSASQPLTVCDGPTFTGSGQNPATRMTGSAMVAPGGSLELGVWTGADESGVPVYSVPSGWQKSSRGDVDSGRQTATLATRTIAAAGQTDEPVATKTGSAVLWTAMTLCFGSYVMPRGAPGIARKIANLTGPGFSTQYGIGGTDLGTMEPTPDGRILAVFGDTFDGATVGGSGWRTPTALYGDPAKISAGVRWTGPAQGSLDGSATRAGQLVPDPHNATLRGYYVTTQLPTDVITIGSTMYMHVMACEGLGNVHFTELYQSVDNGKTWTSTGCWWDNGTNQNHMFEMVTLERGLDGYVYCISSTFSRDSGLQLRRVPEGSIATASAWQTWGYANGAWGWGKAPTVILTGAWGELCLRRLPSGRWLFSGFDAGNYAVTVRDLGTVGPTADFTTAPVATLVRGCDWNAEDHSKGLAAQLYGGYLVPGSTLADAHFAVSQWNTGTNWPYRAMQFKANLAAVFGGS